MMNDAADDTLNSVSAEADLLPPFLSPARVRFTSPYVITQIGRGLHGLPAVRGGCAAGNAVVRTAGTGTELHRIRVTERFVDRPDLRRDCVEAVCVVVRREHCGLQR